MKQPHATGDAQHGKHAGRTGRTIILVIPPEVVAELDETAEERKCSRAAVIREACRQLLVRRAVTAAHTT